MRRGPLADLFRSTEAQEEGRPAAHQREAAAAHAWPPAAPADPIDRPDPAQETIWPAEPADATIEPPLTDEAVRQAPRLEALPTPEPVHESVFEAAPAAAEARRAPAPYTPRDADASSYLAIIRVVGVGGAGLNALARMMEADIQGVEFVALNTDAQQLAMSDAPVKVQLGLELTRGLGSGSDSSVGKRAAEAATDRLRDALRGSDLVFVAAGEGGGTGTGAAPVVARIARELGALTVGIVTLPFRFEGSRRRATADEGLERLRAEVDTLITVPNDRLLDVLDKSTAMVDAFRVADDVLRQGVQGICDLITRPGLINLDFADVRTVMQTSGNALMGIGMATGSNRSADAARRAIDSPLLEVEIRGATGIILSIAGGDDLSLHEITDAANVVQEASSPNANIIFGASIDPELRGQVWVTVIATGFQDGSSPAGRGTSRVQSLDARRQAAARPSPRRRDVHWDADEIEIPAFLRQR
jgi:cell division protein FtsZ